MAERIDLGEFGELVQPCEAIPLGEVWTGPVDGDPFRAFGPGTTKGGRAEAGWFEIGMIAEDGIRFTPDDGTLDA